MRVVASPRSIRSRLKYGYVVDGATPLGTPITAVSRKVEIAVTKGSVVATRIFDPWKSSPRTNDHSAEATKWSAPT